MDFLPKAFEALNGYSQFVIYKVTASKTRQGKTDKIPIHPTLYHPVDPHDRANWLSASAAIQAAKQAHAGVGFVFTEHDPFFFLDIDGCATDGAWSPLANELMAAFPGAAIEISNSGQGLHIIGRGVAPPHSMKNPDGLHIELYTEKRFVALTGKHAVGNAGLEYTNVLQWLVEKYFPPSNFTIGEWTHEAHANYYSESNDDQLLERMLRSSSGASAFGGKATFKDLWERNIDVLAQTYPAADKDYGYDESSADAALIAHLAFWTGNNCERIREFMLRSGLARDKWNREDYLPRSILAVCGRQTTFLKDNPPQLNTTVADSQDGSEQCRPVTGNTFLTLEQQVRHFMGCVYILDDHRVLIPGGYVINQDRFRTLFGGFSFPVDASNGKVTKNAWEAFTESQLLRAPRAHSGHFKPNLTPGAIIDVDGELLVNLYWPVKTARQLGDVTPFLKHLAKLFPVERDCLIVLAYLAAVVQHKGVKFQWCPVIQGVEGNGKTLLTRCVAFAVGDRYTHYPKAAEIAGKFNDWLYKKVFIGIEDVYFPDAKIEIMETLKPMVTNYRQEIEPKGGAKVTRDICANFLINTNHKDGLRKTEGDRRFAIFYSAQQSIGDLTRDGMDGDYFYDLYDWLNNRGGYAIVCKFLHTYAIPDEFNPATTCLRAPITSSTREALEQGRGAIESEVLEAIEAGVLGFRGGYVSSPWLEHLLEKLNATRRVPTRKRRAFMQSLGYDWHPALNNGRLNNPLPGEATLPRIYIKNGHADLALTTDRQVAQAYQDAQASI